MCHEIHLRRGSHAGTVGSARSLGASRLLATTPRFDNGAEEKLFHTYEELAKTSSEKLNSGEYLGFLKAMMELKEPVDQFFDDVMVMVEDDQVRNNRLNLLTAINHLILKVGDISKMHTG